MCAMRWRKGSRIRGRVLGTRAHDTRRSGRRPGLPCTEEASARGTKLPGACTRASGTHRAHSCGGTVQPMHKQLAPTGHAAVALAPMAHTPAPHTYGQRSWP